MNQMCLLLMCVVLTGLVTGCEHKDLCYDHETHTPRVEYLLSLSYDIEWEYNLESHIQWEQYWNEDFGVSYDDIRPDHPEGVRVHIYNEDDQSEIVRNIDKDGSTIHFTDEGHYSVLMHNNDTEYIVYEGMNSFATAYATTRNVARSTYLGNPYVGSESDDEEETVNPPVNAPCEPTEPHPEPVPRKIRKSGTGCLYQINDNLWEGSFFPRLPGGKRKKFNVYAETREQCEIKLAEMIERVKAEIAEEKKRLKSE